MDSRNVFCLLLFIGVGTAKIHLQNSNNDSKSPYKICVNEGLETERCTSGNFSNRRCLNLSLEINWADEVSMNIVNGGETIATVDGYYLLDLVKYIRLYSNQNTSTPVIFERITQPEREYMRIFMGYGVLYSPWNLTMEGFDEEMPEKLEVFCGRISDINVNLDANKDINSLDHVNLTAIAWAVVFGDVEIVQQLIKRGADVTHVYKDNTTIIHVAAISGNEELLNILLNQGARADVVSKHGVTPLFFAAEAGNVNVGKKLLSLFSSSVNITDSLGQTPLHEAAKHQDPAFVDFLVSSGADIMARDKSGQTALHVAAAKGGPAVIQSLVKAGIPIDEKDEQERTPLMLASSWERKENVQTLIKLGADAKALN